MATIQGVGLQGSVLPSRDCSRQQSSLKHTQRPQTLASSRKACTVNALSSNGQGLQGSSNSISNILKPKGWDRCVCV